jgi:hypothetical protein
VKRAFVPILLTIVLISILLNSIPAFALTVPTPANLSLSLTTKSERWCTLTVKWSGVSLANAGYELVIIKSNGQSKTFYPAKGSTRASYTLSNDDFTVKLRAVNKSSSGVITRSAYATKSVGMVNPTITLNRSFLAVRPGESAQLSPKTVPLSAVAYTVGDASVASVSASGVVTGKKHGSTTVTVQSGVTKKTAKVYVSFTTSQIQAVCAEKGYVTNAYWSYSKSTGDPTAYTASPYKATTSTATGKNRPGDGDYVGYSFDYASECMGFAHYIGYRISGIQPKQGWTKYTSKEAIKAEGGLMIGDILRTSGHSAILYNIGGDGTLYFAEAWGGNNNLIKIGGRFAGTSTNLTLDTIPGFVYVYRCNQ